LVLQDYRTVGRDVSDQDRERRPRVVVTDPYPSGERRRDVERSGLRVELDPREAAAERSLAGVREIAPQPRAPGLVLRRLEEINHVLGADAVRVGEPGAVVRLELDAVLRRPPLARGGSAGDRSGAARRVSEELV